MCRTRIKQHSSNLITHRKSTFDDVPCSLCLLMSECEDLTRSLGSLMLMLLTVGSLVSPSLEVLASRLLRSTCLLMLLLGTELLLRWLGCWSYLLDRWNKSWSSRRCRKLKHRGLGLTSSEWAEPGNVTHLPTVVARSGSSLLLLLVLTRMLKLTLLELTCRPLPLKRLLLKRCRLRSDQGCTDPPLLLAGLQPL